VNQFLDPFKKNNNGQSDRQIIESKTDTIFSQLISSSENQKQKTSIQLGEWLKSEIPHRSTNAALSSTKPSSIINQQVTEKNMWQTTQVMQSPLKTGTTGHVDIVGPRNFNWENEKLSETLPPLPENLILEDLALNKQGLAQFFTPGWKGEGLLSKTGLELQSIFRQLWADGKNQFEQHNLFNKSLKLSIYNHFLSYASHVPLNCEQITSPSSFWAHLEDKQSPYREHLDQFTDIFTFRGVVVYLFKIKFVLQLAHALNFQLQDSILFNFNNFIARIFPRGSSLDFPCESLQSNCFTWYRPSPNSKDLISGLLECLNEVTINEMMKVCTYKNFQKNSHAHTGIEGEHALKFSHSLSHKAFGLFLTELMMNFPRWAECGQRSVNVKNDTISAKFVGEYLFSLSQGHWLAQEKNLSPNWDSVICPDFQGDEFGYGSFIKICHELHFLSFLVRLAALKKKDVTQFISLIMRQKYAKSREGAYGQVPLLNMGLEGLDDLGGLVYDRIILNLLELPKRNPFHYVLSQFQMEETHLAPNGVIYLFTNQNLFVPSQSDKVNQLLEKFKIEGFFNFSELQGKGELADYLYIFTKNRQPLLPGFSGQQGMLANKKYACPVFGLEGELKQFQYFHQFVKGFRDFLKTKSNSLAIYQKDIGAVGQLHFHQDAIVDGKLLNAMTSTERPTHPNFFRALTKSAIAFEQIFQIESLEDSINQLSHPKESFHNWFNSNSEKNNEHPSGGNKDNPRWSITEELLGTKAQPSARYPLVLVVNLTNPEQIGLEIIRSESYLAKKEQCGIAYYQYYGLTPKIYDININGLKHFLKSEIGGQIIQFSLSGGNTKVKGKLRSLLIPQALCRRESFPQELLEKYPFIQLQVDDLARMEPSKIAQNLQEMKDFAGKYLTQYPWHTLAMASHFAFLIEETQIRFYGTNNAKGQNEGGELKINSINYQNPVIFQPLTKLPNYPIYPRNSDVFVDFSTKSPEHIYFPMAQVQVSQNLDQYCLEIYSEKGLAAKLYASSALVKFMQFLAQRLMGRPISQVISGLRVPKSSELEEILRNNLRLEKELESLHLKALAEINNNFRRLFSHT